MLDIIGDLKSGAHKNENYCFQMVYQALSLNCLSPDWVLARIEEKK